MILSQYILGDRPVSVTFVVTPAVFVYLGLLYKIHVRH